MSDLLVFYKNNLQKIKITNSNPQFNKVYKNVKNRLPERVRDIIEFENSSVFF